MIFEVLLTRTKKGYPAVWEEGGGYTNTGEAQIICTSIGSAKKPVYIRRAGHLANSNDALFILEKGDVLISAEHHRGDFTIHLYRWNGEIKKDDNENEYAVFSLLAEFSQGEWDNEKIAETFAAAIAAAKEKALCYHCREPHYYKTA